MEGDVDGSSASADPSASPGEGPAGLLTVVLVTSPVRSNPSTEMLETTLGSYVGGGALTACPKLIVSDGYTVAADGQQPKPKSGRVAEAWVAPYAEFRDRLDAFVDLPASSGRCRHLRMAEHKGFGGCVYSALRHVTTPYVLVLQHDRPCLRAFDTAGILAIMEASGGSVKYVGLPTKASLARSEPHNLMSRWHICLDGDDISAAATAAAATVGYQMRVLPFWYDSTHICLASHYRDFVFKKGRVPGGGFPEDSLGQEMHAEICAAAQAGSWQQVHARYATFLVTDGGGPVVGHLRGRRYNEEAKLSLHGWSGLQRRPVASPTVEDVDGESRESSPPQRAVCLQPASAPAGGGPSGDQQQ